MCQPELQEAMWQNVLLAGGNTNFSFLSDRIQSELDKLAHRESHTAKVIAPVSRETSVWLGGSVMASLGNAFVGQSL